MALKWMSKMVMFRNGREGRRAIGCWWVIVVGQVAVTNGVRREGPLNAARRGRGRDGGVGGRAKRRSRLEARRIARLCRTDFRRLSTILCRRQMFVVMLTDRVQLLPVR